MDNSDEVFGLFILEKCVIPVYDDFQIHNDFTCSKESLLSMIDFVVNGVDDGTDDWFQTVLKIEDCDVVSLDGESYTIFI